MNDRIISKYEAVDFGDGLKFCEQNGIVYQEDTESSIDYDVDYFNIYIKREGTNIANQLNDFRTSITAKHVNRLLDVGIGSGEFIRKSKIKVFGFDINLVAVKMLKEQNLFLSPYTDDLSQVDGVSLWDVLEHFPSPTAFLDLLHSGHYLFVSIPIFDDLKLLKSSKHFKKNEHYIYFTKDGIVNYFKDAGFELLEVSDAESKAGRENVLSFVFRKL